MASKHSSMRLTGMVNCLWTGLVKKDSRSWAGEKHHIYHIYIIYIIVWPGLSSISTHGLSAMFDFKVEGVKFQIVSILQVAEST